MVEVAYAAGVLLAVGGATALAIQNVALRLGTVDGRATDAVAIVAAVNVLVILPLTVIRYYPEFGLTWRAVWSFLAAGLVGTMIGRALVYGSIERIGAGRTTPIVASNALVATVVAIAVLGESVAPTQFLGVVLIVCGVAFISWETSKTERIVSRRKLVIGLSLPFAGALFYGIEPVLASIGLAEGTPILVGLTLRTGIGLVGFLLYLRWRGLVPKRASFSPGNGRWYLLAGVMNTLFLLGYYAALELAPVSVVYPIIQTNVLLVLLLSAWFVSNNLEHVTAPLVVAAALVVVGVITITVYG